ncbi:MAG: glucose-6-phosphate dehydrogenase assembly protein OpcA [Burkholderiales bacterium]
MPDTKQLESFTAGVETAVDVAQIERQLGELWQLAAESEKDPARRSVTRACLCNFVVFCETDAARDHATDTISTLTSRYPCRAIVLLVQPDAPQAELSASITAHCHLAGGGRKQVCCEQIAIHATGQSVADLSGALLPLLESDLPTIVWWQGNFLKQPELLRRLSAVADRILFDTAMWPEPATQLAALARTVAEASHCNFDDLSWTRLRLWRQLTAEFFDDPDCRAELERIERLEITHGRGPGAGLRALLYAAWFAAQLGWPAAAGWSPADASRTIKVRARDDSDATAVGIISITLKSASAEFVIRKNYGERTASAVVTMPNACGLPRKRAFWPTDDASLLSQELDHSARHTVYDRALAMAAALAERGAGRD